MGGETVVNDFKDKLKEWISEEEKVGNVYDVRGSYYGLNIIPITITRGKEIPRWSYVFVKHWKTGNPVVFQIIDVYFDQPGTEYQDASISMGNPIKDPSMRKYKCKGLLVGEINENGEIIPPRYPIEPEADVYRCPKDMIEFVTQPLDEWNIKVGEIPELGIPVKIHLEPLVRQGLLITGAQGTGKTTALITLITRATLANPPLKFLILDWTGEFRSVEKVINSIKEKLKEGDKDYISKVLGRDVSDLDLDVISNASVSVIEWWRMYCGFLEDEFIQYFKPILDGIIAQQRQFSDTVKKYARELVNYADKLTIERLEELADIRRGRREETTVIGAKAIINNVLSSYLPKNDDEFEKWKKYSYIIDELKEDIVENNVVIVDFSASLPEDLSIVDDVEIKSELATMIAKHIWDIGSRDPNFGCVIVIDEAHRVCPEKDLGYMDPIWQRLASEGGRNKIPLWIVARRLSLVSKKVTTELQQNFFCFNVEDVDRKRVEEDLGKSFAELVPYGTIPPLHCIIKSNGFRIPGQIVFTKIDVVERPAGGKLSKDVFKEMSERARNRNK
ncbi:MAG TPA: ATP-binding protein [Candidatus Nanopusillus sp.]|nr:ATP-binding protein [Candidatus Nanopusillus sp.]